MPTYSYLFIALALFCIAFYIIYGRRYRFGKPSYCYESLFLHNFDAILLVDPDGKPVQANSKVSEITGYSVDELLDLNPLSLVVRTDRSVAIAMFNAALIENPQVVELRILHKQGHQIDITLKAVPVRSDDNLIGVHLIGRDITSHKVEQANLQSFACREKVVANLGLHALLVTDLQILLDDTVSQLSHIRSADYICAMKYDANKGVCQSQAIWPPHLPAQLPSELPAQSTASHMGYTLDVNEPVVINDVAMEKRFDTSYLLSVGVSSAIAIAIRGPKGPWGVFGVYAKNKNAFNQNNVFFIQSVANIISAAIQHLETDAALQESEERFRQAFESAMNGMGLLSLQGDYLRVNQALSEMLGYSRTDMVGMSCHGITHPEDRLRNIENHHHLLSGELDSYQWEKRYMHKLGHSVWVLLSLAVVRDNKGQPHYLIAQINDITEQKRFEEQLINLADRDPLTDLYNRRRFQDELSRHLAHAIRYKTYSALLYLDLDNFKDINDTLGHHCGDELLISVARLLKSRLRGSDIVARLGGDEFAILLPVANQAQAEVVAADILKELRRHTVILAGKPIGITASIGITSLYADGTKVEEILANADRAMYQAKELGKNRYHVYTAQSKPATSFHVQLDWDKRIRQALDDDLFLLHYQPVLDLKSGQICQFELLLRMLSQVSRLIQPTAFLGQAQRFGLLNDIDRWVVSNATRIIAEQTGFAQPIRVSINLSMQAVADKSLIPYIKKCLDETQIDPSQLALEIPEAALNFDSLNLGQTTEALRKLGCPVIIDGYGSSFAAFQRLKQVACDELKLDSKLIENLAEDELNQHLVRAALEVAKGLHLRTTAKNVTDAHTLKLLHAYGVDRVQGFYIGAPSNTIDQWLTQPEVAQPDLQ